MTQHVKIRRVAVTGMATINPLADTLDGYLEALLAGRSGIGRWESLDTSRLECQIGGDLGAYDTGAALERLRPRIDEPLFKRVRKLFRSATFPNRVAILCALDATLDAGLGGFDVDPYRVSTIVAGHNFNARYVDENERLFSEDPDLVHPLFGLEALDTNIAGCIAEVLGVRGPALTVGGACASGNLALRDGWRDVASGECAAAVVTGTIFDFTPRDLHAMAALRAVVSDPELNDRPSAASRPCDRGRKGFVPSHGAGTIVLEDLEGARSRHARIWAELVAVKANSDACHLPAPNRESQVRLLGDLLEAGGVRPDEVDYVNLHSTSTPAGDVEEIRALEEVFGAHLQKMKCNAPKSMLGHTCWSAAIVETIGALLQARGGVLAPTINLDDPDPELPVGVDLCANGPVEHRVRCLVKNSFGFGGINCSALYRLEPAP